MDCCSQKHLVIIGGGSAAFSAATKAHALGARVTLINAGTIGGTCVNVGCVPSKTLIRAAEAHHRANHSQFSGVTSSSELRDFGTVVREKTELVEALRQAKYLDVVSDLPDFERIEGHGRIVDAQTVEVNGKTIQANHILIATGSSVKIPPIPGLESISYLTSTTAFELTDLPKSMIVLGGRYIALECAQMFARFGTKITVLQRSSRILPTETPDITDALTTYLTEEGMNIVTDVSIKKVFENGKLKRVHTMVAGEPRTFEASEILVATGRTPNSSNLGLENVGIHVDEHGFIQVDDTLQTSIPGIYAAGDVIGEPAFVYTAAYEGGLAIENALSDTSRERDYAPLPWVIFTDPQIAGVGIDELKARNQGLDVETSLLPLEHVPRSLAARDTRGFIKLIRNTNTDKLVGARILAPEGSELLMEVTLAIKYGITVQELIGTFHPYLTLGEGIKLAALTFGKDVSKLSCCAT